MSGDERYWAHMVLDVIENVECPMLMYEGEKMIVRKAIKAYIEANDRIAEKTEPQTDDLQDWKDRMWAEAVQTDCTTCDQVGRCERGRAVECPLTNQQTDCPWK